MIDLQDKGYAPALEEIAAYVRNPVFNEFCRHIMETYQCREKIEFSCCSMASGWNIKFKKAGKSLCTVYPKEFCFTVLVVVGQKEKAAVEAMLDGSTPALQELYANTAEGNGQRWLMIDLEDANELYQDVLRLVQIRRG